MKASLSAAFCLFLCCGLCAGIAVAQPQQINPETLRTGRPASPAQPAPQQPAPAQPERELTPEEKAMEEAAAPDENHAKLKKYLGRWDGTMKLHMGPEPVETTTTVIARWEPGMGERFLIQDHNGRIMDRPFRGTSTWGYNKVTKKYESVWRDNMGTGMMISYGEMSADTKTLTFNGQYDDPMTGGKMKTREVYTWESDDVYTFEMFQTGSDGKETKVVEGKFTKSQSVGRPGIQQRPVTVPNKPAEPAPK
ncbi:MAG: hypothetical protein GIKADHBN_01653 [Phycisphaerales bacterium]|nr:hypothetical protein [Phycisphaerales bacterium]MCK6477797.1 DUF1579 domain-containing protein [Phycisphaerales bacterium]